MRARLHFSSALAVLSCVAILGCSRQPESRSANSQTHGQPQAPVGQPATLSAEASRRQAADNIDGPIDDFLKANSWWVPPDARDWAKNNPKTLPGGTTLDAMLTTLASAGARRINVITNFFCDYLILVTLPSEATPRQKIFAADAKLRDAFGMQKIQDLGQKYLPYLFGAKSPLWINPPVQTKPATTN